MDISDIVNWGTIVIWVVGTILWLGRLLRGEITVHPWVDRLLSSNVLIGFVIGAGLISTGGVMYLNYSRDHERLLEDVTVSAYAQGTSQFQLVSGQTFENESIPLDGHVYDHCTFTNVCLLYDGGAYQLQHDTFKDHWKICVRESPLKNYMDLAFALHLTRREVTHTQKSVIMQR